MKRAAIFAGQTIGFPRIPEGKYQKVCDWVLTEIFRWLPALTFFAFYLANRNALCLTYAIAFTLWPCVKRSLSVPMGPFDVMAHRRLSGSS